MLFYNSRFNSVNTFSELYSNKVDTSYFLSNSDCVLLSPLIRLPIVPLFYPIYRRFQYQHSLPFLKNILYSNPNLYFLPKFCSSDLYFYLPFLRVFHILLCKNRRTLHLSYRDPQNNISSKIDKRVRDINIVDCSAVIKSYFFRNSGISRIDNT